MFTSCLLLSTLLAQTDLLQYAVRHSLAGKHSFVQFSADGTQALALSGERLERIRVSSGSVVSIPAPPPGKHGLAIGASRDLTRVVAGDSDGAIHVLLQEGSFSPFPRAHKGRVLAAAISLDGTLAASSGIDKRVLIWDLGSRSIRHSMQPKSAVHYLMFRAASIVGVGADGSISEWDANSGKLLRQMQDPDNSIHAATLDSSGDLLALGTEFSAMTKGNPMRPAHPSDFHRENRLRLYDLRRGASVKEIGQVQGQLRSISISPDGRFAIATRHQQTTAAFAVFDLVRGVEIAGSQIPLDSAAIHFAADGRWLASPLADGGLGLFEVSGVQRSNTVSDLAGQKFVITSANSQPVFGPNQAKLSIAVMPFDARNLNADTGAAIADMIGNRLSGLNTLELVDRARLERILAEQNIQNSDRVDSATAVRLGRLLNVAKLIFGSVNQLGATFTIAAQIIDVETGRIENIREVLCQRCQIDDLPQAAAVLGGAMIGQR
jgi:WD40 repeat protein